MTFVLPTAPEVRLCPGGDDRVVKVDNVGEYLGLVESSLGKVHRPCLEAFAGQLSRVVQLEHLAYFRPEEVNLLFCGETGGEAELSVESLAQHVLPMHGYSRESVQYRQFLEVLAGMPLREKSLFF